MYDTIGSAPLAESCKEPNWEQEHERGMGDLKVVKDFRNSLFAFIQLIDMYSGRRDGCNFLAELLGTVEIDIIEREKRLKQIAKKIEG